MIISRLLLKTQTRNNYLLYIQKRLPVFAGSLSLFHFIFRGNQVPVKSKTSWIDVPSIQDEYNPRYHLIYCKSSHLIAALRTADGAPTWISPGVWNSRPGLCRPAALNPFSLQLGSVIHTDSAAGFPPLPALWKWISVLLLFVMAFHKPIIM